MLKIGILEGDDIGLEVVPEAVKVMKAAAAATGLAIDWQPLPIGRRGHESHGHTMPAVTVEALAHVDGRLQGPIGHNAYPRNDPTWINPPLRKKFELFASVKPVKSYPNLPSLHKDVDIVFLREVTEGMQSGSVVFAGTGEFRPNDEVSIGMRGIVAAGPAEALQRCKPLFDVIGRRTFEAGASPDAATSIKLANNFMLGCAVQAMGEAYSLVRRFGVAPQVLHDVMTEGLFSAPAYKVYGRIMADEAYDNVGFTTRLALKDMSLVLAAGDMARVPLPSASLLRDRLLAAIAHGDADRDWAVLAREQARTAGLE